jgi:hypothetical protein
MRITITHSSGSLFDVLQAPAAIGRALGAQASQVRRMIVGQGVSPVLAGVAVGALGAVAVGRVIASLLFDVGARDPFVIAGVAAVVPRRRRRGKYARHASGRDDRSGGCVTTNKADRRAALSGPPTRRA